MEQELNIAYDQKLTREVWQRVAQSLPPLEAPTILPEWQQPSSFC